MLPPHGRATLLPMMLRIRCFPALLALGISCGDPSGTASSGIGGSTSSSTENTSSDASTGPSTSTTAADTTAATSSSEGTPACTDPTPATTQDVTLATDTGALHGTWMTPEGCAPFATVLLHVGSGPTDRDGNTAIIRGSNDGHLQLAQALQDAGVASLRFDKRGVAASAQADVAGLVLDSYVDDLTAWVELLRADPDMVGPLTLLGHSEGSLVATIVARTAGVDALVCVAGAGRPFGDVLLTQLTAALGDPELLAEAAAIIDALEMGNTVDDVPPELQFVFAPSLQPYLISLFARDPAEELAAVTVPVTVVVGSSDTQVPVSEGELLVTAQPRATLVVIDGMTHVFKSDAQGQDAAYSDPTVPLADGFVDAIVTAVAPPTW